MDSNTFAIRKGLHLGHRPVAGRSSRCTSRLSFSARQNWRFERPEVVFTILCQTFSFPVLKSGLRRQSGYFFNEAFDYKWLAWPARLAVRFSGFWEGHLANPRINSSHGRHSQRFAGLCFLWVSKAKSVSLGFKQKGHQPFWFPLKPTPFGRSTHVRHQYFFYLPIGFWMFLVSPSISWWQFP